MSGVGRQYPSEAHYLVEGRSGLRLRQVTAHPSIHHHPFFFVPAYDAEMRWLFFISHRSGHPQIMLEDRATGALVQVTDRPDLAEWSVVPDRQGRFIAYTAGGGAFVTDLATLVERQVADFGDVEMREKGMVGAAMGTTALSATGRYWAIPVKAGASTRFVLVDLDHDTVSTFLERDTIGHPQFCPDDDDLILYAGPLTDRVWITDRSGMANRRLYRREDPMQWVTHEVWWPKHRSVLFVDWPNGMRAIDVDTGALRWMTRFPVWHGAPAEDGNALICDTNVPDIGLHAIDLTAPQARPRFLALSRASSQGSHWAGPFPYNNGPIKVHAPQHTHPHPRFSPDGRRAVFTSDVTGVAQVYEVELSE